jgi:hypothetical protein
MKYLQQTTGLTMTLETQDITSIKWWIDASYATHPDMRSHTGGVLIIGKGFYTPCPIPGGYAHLRKNFRGVKIMIYFIILKLCCM